MCNNFSRDRSKYLSTELSGDLSGERKHSRTLSALSFSSHSCRFEFFFICILYAKINYISVSQSINQFICHKFTLGSAAPLTCPLAEKCSYPKSVQFSLPILFCVYCISYLLPFVVQQVHNKSSKWSGFAFLMYCTLCPKKLLCQKLTDFNDFWSVKS